MFKCNTCGMETPEGKSPDHDRACWNQQLTELYFALNLFVNFDTQKDSAERLKEIAIKTMKNVRAKNDPTYKLTGA